MTADPLRAAEDLREVLQGQIRLCTARARQLDQYVFNWEEDVKEKKALFAEIQLTLRICEQVQKAIARMRKAEHEDRCRGSCESFAAAVLSAREAERARRESAGDDGAPSGE
ncbi:MAG: hypothetical protein ACYTKD_13500 [Planctomycetota bacterium]